MKFFIISNQQNYWAKLFKVFNAFYQMAIMESCIKLFLLDIIGVAFSLVYFNIII